MIHREGAQGNGAGRLIGTTDWIRLPQETLTSFEVLTRSNDPLHMDPEWVRQHTDLRGTIVPGFLTLALLPFFAAQLRIEPEGHYALNYGFDRVRWVAPVGVDAEVRARFVDAGTAPLARHPSGYIARFEVTVEIRGEERPALVAIWLGAMIPHATTRGPA